MRFQFTAAFTLLLLNALASSFGSYCPKKIHPASSFSCSQTPSVSRGGTAFEKRLSASVDSASPSVTAEVTSENLELLSERGRNAIVGLIEHDVDGIQRHVYGNWPESGIQDEGKRHLADQVSFLSMRSSSGGK